MIETGDIDALMQWLFETPREVFQPVSGELLVWLPASEIDTEESGSTAEAQTRQVLRRRTHPPIRQRNRI